MMEHARHTSFSSSCGLIADRSRPQLTPTIAPDLHSLPNDGLNRLNSPTTRVQPGTVTSTTYHKKFPFGLRAQTTQIRCISDTAHTPKLRTDYVSYLPPVDNYSTDYIGTFQPTENREATDGKLTSAKSPDHHQPPAHRRQRGNLQWPVRPLLSTRSVSLGAQHLLRPNLPSLQPRAATILERNSGSRSPRVEEIALQPAEASKAPPLPFPTRPFGPASTLTYFCRHAFSHHR